MSTSYFRDLTRSIVVPAAALFACVHFVGCDAPSEKIGKSDSTMSQKTRPHTTLKPAIENKPGKLDQEFNQRGEIKKAEFKGTITSIGETIVLFADDGSEREILVNDETKFQVDGVESSLADIKASQFATIQTNIDGDTLTATSVLAKSRQFENRKSKSKKKSRPDSDLKPDNKSESESSKEPVSPKTTSGEFDGRIKEVNASELTITDPAGAVQRFMYDRELMITLDGTQAKIRDLQAGNPIRVTAEIRSIPSWQPTTKPNRRKRKPNSKFDA